jgi:hypothetical protein
MSERAAAIVAGLLALAIALTWTVGSSSASANNLSKSGRIGWLMRHEQRGESLGAAHIRAASLTGSHWQTLRFARVIAPRTFRGGRIALSLIGRLGRNVCMTVFIGARSRFGGCGLKPAPITFSVASVDRTRLVLAGVVRDGVSRVSVVTARHATLRVPLVENAYFRTLSRSDLPAGLFAHGEGKILGSVVARPLPGSR